MSFKSEHFTDLPFLTLFPIQLCICVGSNPFYASVNELLVFNDKGHLVFPQKHAFEVHTVAFLA